MSKQDQRRIYSLFKHKPVSYNTGLAEFIGSIEAALLLGQLLYWQGLGRDKQWTFKTIAEMRAETGLTRHKQASAILLCKEKGVLKVKLAGIPAKRYFHIDLDMLRQQITSLPNTDKLDRGFVAGSTTADRLSTSKSTQRTTKNTSERHQALQRSKEALIKKMTP